MTEAEVEKLRSAGIDDAVILGLQKDEAVKNGQAAPVVQSKSALPEVNPNTPSTVFEQAQAAGVPTAGREQNWAQTALELAPVVGDTLVKAIPYVAGGVGLLGAGRLVNAAKTAAEAYKAGEATKAAAVTANSATHAATQEMKVLQQLAQQQGPHADAARQRLAQLIQSKGPTVPTAAPVVPSAVAPSSILDAQGRPMQMQPRPMPPAPAAPAYMPPAAPAPAAPAPSVNV